MKYPKDKVMIEKLKDWYGWDEDMVEMIKKKKVVKVMYSVMLREKGLK